MLPEQSRVQASKRERRKCLKLLNENVEKEGEGQPCLMKIGRENFPYFEYRDFGALILCFSFRRSDLDQPDLLALSFGLKIGGSNFRF